MHTPLRLFPEPDETLEGTALALREGRTTCAAVLERCFHQIDLWDEKVHAWVYVDRSGAMRQARALDEELKAGRCRSALHGIPVGVKDIIDVAGMPTACGFRPWERRVADRDAEVVAGLRDAGAVLLGKTVTTQFAWIDPPVTRNPWDLGRTPGGSSSGSAAAVATGMCLAAVGTQTGGSVTRPAAFCGVAASKWPNYPHLWGDGILPFAPSLDCPGVFARTARDAWLAELSLGQGGVAFLSKEGGPSPDEVSSNLRALFAEVVDGPNPRYGAPPVLVRPRGYFDRRAEVGALAAFDAALGRLAAAGARVVEADDAGWDFDGIVGDHRRVMAAEAATGHEARIKEHAADYAPHIRGLVEEGLAVPVTRYVRAVQLLGRRRTHLFRDLAGGADAVVTPAAVGPAPDPSTTGNPCMNSPWSYLGLPVYSMPTGLAGDGLPLALQLTGSGGGGLRNLAATAVWCERALRPGPGLGGA